MNIILLVVLLLVLVVAVYIAMKVSTTQNAGTKAEDAVRDEFEKLDEKIRKEFVRNREEFNLNARSSREELQGSFKIFEEALLSQFNSFSQKLDKLTLTLENKMDSFTRGTREDLKNSNDTLIKQLSESSHLQKTELKNFSDKLEKLAELNEQKFESLREKLEYKFQQIQESNAQKLEEMRQTVDEKLHTTLEKRLGDSFKIVSERLELVHKGLGEMQSLATGVGDLKKVLSNVKTRGILGEYQLEAILEQVLNPDHYSKDIATKKGSSERVEFAVKIPAKDEKENFIYLPIDSKFPQDKYEVLLKAYDTANPTEIEQSIKELEQAIKKSAKDIRDKYIDPPNTTDFAVMFLPFEGLYAEVVKRPVLIQLLQQDYKVNVTGPSTLAAFLNSLQMGFRTLAIQKRSSEVWSLLGVVKTEFGKFGDVLEKTQKKLLEASNTIDDASKRSRAIERKLRDVQELPQNNSEQIFEIENE
jgi:DNA recombination protein RmuC